MKDFLLEPLYLLGYVAYLIFTGLKAAAGWFK